MFEYLIFGNKGASIVVAARKIINFAILLVALVRHLENENTDKFVMNFSQIFVLVLFILEINTTL